MRRLIVLVAIAAMGTSAATATAGGGGAKVPTNVVFDYFCGSGFCQNIPGIPIGDDWLFLGHVESPREACRAGRRIEVFERVPGKDKSMGSDRADSRGAWLVRRPDYTTTTSVWYAKAVKKKLGPGKRCKPDRSNEVAD